MKALLRYRFLDNLKGVAVLALVLTFVSAGLPLMLSLFVGEGEMGMSSSYTMASMIFALITGIVTGRMDLRLGNQMGICRRSAFAGCFLGNAATYAVLSVMITLLTLIFQLANKDDARIGFVELYQLFYSTASYIMPPVEYLKMTLLNFLAFTAAGVFGMLCTMAFWRLGRVGKWALGVCGGLLIVVGLPFFMSKFDYLLLRPIRILTTNPWAMMAVLLALAALGTGISWLLTRKAPILAPGK